MAWQEKIARAILILVFASSGSAATGVSNAAPARIKFAGEPTAMLCAQDEAGQGYVCESKSGPVLVYSPPLPAGVGMGMGFGFRALSLNGDHPDLISSPTVEEIKEGDRIVFSVNRAWPGIGGFGGPPSPTPTQISALPGLGSFGNFAMPPSHVENNSLTAIYGDSLLAAFFNSKVVDETPTSKQAVRHRGGTRYEEVLAIFRRNWDESRQKILAALKQNAFVLELADGRKVPCAKGQDRQYTEQEVRYIQNFGIFHGCQIMKCGPAKIRGKELDISLLVPYSDTIEGIAVIQALAIADKEGIVENIPVRRLHSPSLKHPLISYNPEYEKFFSNLAKQSNQPNIKPSLEELIHPMMKLSIEQFKGSCAPSDPAVQFFDTGYRNLRKNVAAAAVVQFIEANAFGIQSRWGRPNDATHSGYCSEDGVFLNKEALSNRAKLKSLAEPSNPKSISRARAVQLFAKARAMDDIAWNYTADGCYARAHLMARRFEAEGVEVGKVWIKGELSIPARNIGWGMHVAPVVYVENDHGEIERMVIDPSIASGPVTVKEWSAIMQKDVFGPETYTAFPFPGNASSFERTAIAFSSSEPYLDSDSLNKTESEKMGEAFRTMKNYKGLMP